MNIYILYIFIRYTLIFINIEIKLYLYTLLVMWRYQNFADTKYLADASTTDVKNGRYFF